MRLLVGIKMATRIPLVILDEHDVVCNSSFASFHIVIFNPLLLSGPLSALRVELRRRLAPSNWWWVLNNICIAAGWGREKSDIPSTVYGIRLFRVSCRSSGIS